MSRSYATTRYASTGGGSSYIVPISGSVDGNNTSFVWAQAPSVIVVDQGRAMQKVNNGGLLSTNWTGTTNTNLTIAPNWDIFGFT